MAINRKSNGAVIFYPLALLLTTLLAVLSASQVWATDVEGVRVWRAPDHTRVVLDLSDAATFKHFTLNNPERVVVDIQSAK
ncbi:MAG: AMIN domain-containing protein, partial [Pseudomonadales bacterium]|nr:AMIN domain-containing protein [Pseudomonadales bacterium]